MSRITVHRSWRWSMLFPKSPSPKFKLRSLIHLKLRGGGRGELFFSQYRSHTLFPQLWMPPWSWLPGFLFRAVSQHAIRPPSCRGALYFADTDMFLFSTVPPDPEHFALRFSSFCVKMPFWAYLAITVQCPALRTPVPTSSKTDIQSFLSLNHFNVS